MKCPTGHDVQRSRNLIPEMTVLVCRLCGLMRLEELGDWVPAAGGLDRLSELARETRQQTKADRQAKREQELTDAIEAMEFE
jgi:hypothetical protein